MNGVSVDFFGAAIKHLEKRYRTKRLAAPWETFERFRAALAEAEQAYLELQEEAKPVRKKGAST